MKASILIVCAAVLSAGTAVRADHNSKNGDGWASMPSAELRGRGIRWQRPGPAPRPECPDDESCPCTDTGPGTKNPQGTTILAFFQEQLLMSAGDVLSLNVWADNTVRVTMNGVEFNQPCQLSSGFGCAGTHVAFDWARMGTLRYEAGSGDLHTLLFGVYQFVGLTTTQGNPFGLMYAGHLEAAVPLPAALPLFASALAGLGLIGWRRRLAA